ncbi:MAG: hypothetical protein AAB531_04370 [Patescibacteria group bacterium]
MTEFKNPTSVRPVSQTLEALEGEVSDPVTTNSQKPGNEGQKVTVRLVREGAGMAGLEEREDNKEWAGIFNHLVKTARVSTFLAQELQKVGENVNPNLILNTVLISHAGRRQWDEANWYPEAVENAEEKAKMGDQPLAIPVLEKAGTPTEIMEIVESHAVGTQYPIERMDTWEKKLALYADFRVSQNLMNLDERFEDLSKRAVPAGRLTKEQLDAIEAWARKTEEEIFSRISITPAEITDNFPPQPRWERYIRRLYINDAEEGIFARLNTLHDALKAEDNFTFSPEGFQGVIKRMDLEFPENTWWGKYVRQLYKDRHGVPFHPRIGKQRGITRAIEFYKSLESDDQT